MKDTITYEDFAKLDLRIGEIKQVETIPKSKKLLKLTVDFGPEIGQRTVLAGIAQARAYGQITESGIWHDMALIGQRPVFVINLVPRTMFGIESHGMILAGQEKYSLDKDDNEKPNLYLVGCVGLSPGTEIG